MPINKREQAIWLFQEANRAQMEGELDRAAELYKNSLTLFLTAGAHTFLGWTYRFLQGNVGDAIAKRKRAIEVDPEFGNPYNDIGAHLIDLRRSDEAIPWLDRAIAAPGYDPRHFPYFNRGRVYGAKGMLSRGRRYFQDALRIEPRYTLARQAVENLRRMLS